MQKLFIGIGINDTIQESIARSLPPLPGRPVPRGNWHITLHYIGELAPPRVNILLNILQITPWPAPFVVRCGNLGFFRGHNGLLLYCAVIDLQGGLFGLQQKLADVLQHADYVVENRPYTPHITLARAVPHSMKGLLDMDRPYSNAGWEVHTFTLFESRPGPQFGRQYIALQNFTLGLAP